jgi:mannan endo-1,4-beta-mannosidase
MRPDWGIDYGCHLVLLCRIIFLKNNPVFNLMRRPSVNIFLITAGLLAGTLGCGSDDGDDSGNGGPAQPTFKVSGNHLVDPCGDKVVLKGVNKMSVFDEEDPNGDTYMAEIAKTKSNSVRIVWQRTYSNGGAASLTQLEKLIQRSIENKMIPMVEMHDATCNLGGLNAVVDYWTSQPVVSLVQKYEHALIVNIANEAGDYAVTAPAFESAYKQAITRMRNAGIRTPLVIDAPDCGKNLEVLVAVANSLQQHDPDHNIVFSVHTYWSKEAVKYVQPTFIKDQLNAAAALNQPFIIGELAGFGGWPGDGEPDYASCSSKGSIDYQTLLAEVASHDMGYYIWEWGPGNGYYNYDPPKMCPSLDATTDGTYQSIVNIPAGNAERGWVRHTVLDNANSIAKSAAKTAYVQNGFMCK